MCNSVSSAPNYYIECKFVGALSANREYQIGAKVMYASTHTFETVNNDNFGKVEVIGVTVDETDGSLSNDFSLFKSPS